MMARGFDQKGRRSPNLVDRQRQAAAAKENRLAQFRQRLQERQQLRLEEAFEKQSGPSRNFRHYEDALRRVPFLQIHQAGHLHPAKPYEKLTQIALDAMDTGARRAVLCWPSFVPSPAALATMLVLADCESCTAITHGGYAALAAPVGLRTLIYPYARSSHRALRHIYVDKQYLHANQLKHQIRCSRPNEEAALADFHKTLARVHKLTGMTLDGKDYPEFANPCLDELLPSGPCSGKGGRSELLWRVRAKTDLKTISRTGAADDPRDAKFYLFGIWANENADSQLKSLKAAPNLVLLQLDRLGRNRLGRNWDARVKAFLAALEKRHGAVATLALTDDPWSFDRLRFETLFSKPRKRKEPPCASNVIFASNSDIVTDQTETVPHFAPIKDCNVVAYAGQSDNLLRRVRSNRMAALQIGDAETAEQLGTLAGTIRRCVSLPGSRAEYSQYIEAEFGPVAAAELMSPYRTGTILKELRASNSAWPQLARAELTSMCDAIQSALDNTDVITPMKPLLREMVEANFLRNSSRTVFLFQTQQLADFACEVLVADDDIGSKVRDRIEKNMIRFLDRYGLLDLEGLATSERNYIKGLVLVAPSRAATLDLLAKPWLPEKMIVLGDSHTLESVARDTRRLSGYGELAPLQGRFNTFTDKATNEVTRVHGITVELDRSIEPQDDIDAPPSRVLNLAGRTRENQTILRIELSGGQSGGQIIIAKPGTKLVLQDRTNVLPLYKEVEANAVEEGDRVCVIGDAFVETARPLINITKRAAEEIRDYHQLVVRRFALLEGDSIQARLRTLVAIMGLPDVSTDRARYWISLNDQLAAPLDEVVPSAPRDIATFKSFMAALGVAGTVVDRYWIWAVIAQRSHKLQAGLSIRDAYRGILIDSFASQSDNPTRIRELRQLRAAAENFVGVVIKIDTIRSDNAST